MQLDLEQKPPNGGYSNFDTFDLLNLRERAAKLTPLVDYTYVEHENMPGYVVLRHIAGAIAQVTVVLGSYFFLQSTGSSVMPRCHLWEVPGATRGSIESWKESMCYVSSGCFWTYPIICPLAIIVLFWKNLLDKRLFYECLFQRIFLVQRSTSYLTSPIFWALLAYFMCGISCIGFLEYGTERPYKDVIFTMLAYISPTIGFVIVLFNHWSVSRLIISLPMYVERDSPCALDLLRECQVVRDEEFWDAFCSTEKMLHDIMREQKTPFTLNTAEFTRLVMDNHRARKGKQRTCWDGVCHVFGALHERYVRTYWVSRFLFFPCFQDIRSRRFRCWARVYYAFMVLSSMVFIYAMLYTINELAHHYHALPSLQSMYVHLPAPHKVPGVIEHAAELAPAVVGQVMQQGSREISRYNATTFQHEKVALIDFSQRLVKSALSHVQLRTE